ncbi:hypothetical protein [Streptomyces sp. AM8-1-1]|uniref:hypothetical protein n=1 Tax=Streptomyces sp. AM8-1-1 TaxID=3075825 RepID=UPI0028C45891|nr:hypothetical protein [Streptomyces sp. AM8-1-1]WNO74579.1 hypothetical protein RPQ07_24540 [Streptomyces sp. AM8-1-1]
MDVEKRPPAHTPVRRSQGYGGHQAPAGYEPGEGCLTTLVRVPVRIVVLVVVVPVRMVWDLLALGGRALHRTVLRPVGRGLAWVYEAVLTPVGHALVRLAVVLGKAVFVWPWVGLWRYLVVPVVTYGLVVPAVWLYRQVLTPVGRGVAGVLIGLGRGIGWTLGTAGRGIAWLVGRLVVAPARWVHRSLLRPVGQGLAWLAVVLGKVLFVWPWVGLWRYLVVPVVTYGLVVPAVWLYRQVLTPLGHGIVLLAAGLGHGLAVLGRGLWAAVTWVVLTLLVGPVVWLVGTLVVAPLVWIFQRVLVPLGREIGAAFAVAWRVAGYVSSAVGSAVRWLVVRLVVRPVRWFYGSVCTPVGHAVRDVVWRPAKRAVVEAGRAAAAAARSARETIRQARRDAWRALVGGPGYAEPGEPLVPRARTLGSTTTVPGAAAEPEISLHKQG